MTLSIFTWFFETVAGKNTLFPEYRASIYLFIGLCLVTIPPLLSFVFYKIINGFPSFAKFRQTYHWVVTMILSMAIVVTLTLLISKSKTQSSSFDAYMYVLAIVNAIFSCIIFFLASLIFKRFSLHSKFKPIKYIPFNK